LVQGTCAGSVEEFLLGDDKLECGTEFFNHSKSSFKEGRLKKLVGFSFVFFLSWFFNSSEKRLHFAVKINCLVFIHDLERVNEFLRLNSHFKFSSSKVEVV